MLVSFHKTSPSPSLWSEFALVGLSTLNIHILYIYIYTYIKNVPLFFCYNSVYRADYYSKEKPGENMIR